LTAPARRRLRRTAFIVVGIVCLGAYAGGYASSAKWPTNSIVYLLNPTNADVSSDAAERAVQTAAGAWSTQSHANFRFTYGGRVTDTTTGFDGKNVVLFRNATSGSALATTYWWYSGSNIADADIVVWDGAFTFFTGASGCSNGAYIEDVLTHEFGHALGLDHSTDPAATMYPTYSLCSQEMRSLGTDDIAGVEALYPPIVKPTNTAPAVVIASPANGASVVEGTAVAFSGSASDTQDGNLSGNLQWTSSIDGALGSGPSLTRTLSIGSHVITARVTDSGGLSASAAVSVTITPRPVPRVPGTIEAEDFDERAFVDTTPANLGGQYRTTPVDIENCADAGGGYDVGWMDVGEWLEYTVDVASSGTYQITPRIASPLSGTTLSVLMDGAIVGGPLAVPTTGGWQSWQTITTSPLSVTAGRHRIRLLTATGGLNVNKFGVQLAASPSSGHAVPGTIEAEDFDEGAFFDTTPGNLGGEYRSTAVDIEATSDAGGGYNVGWFEAGEWLEYTISSSGTAAYQIAARIASPVPGATLSVLLDGVPIGGPLSLPNTGGWQSWQTVTSAVFTVTAGSHRIRLQTGTGGLNVNRFAVQPAASGSSHPVPGVIEAEDFDDGGFFDTTPDNLGGEYRPTPVDIELTTDIGGGYNIGWMDAGEWLEYTIDVQAAGAYSVAARIASPSSDATLTIQIDGVAVATLAIPNTGWWQSWQTVQSAPVSLTKGTHRLRLLTNTGGLNVNKIAF
jgi:hypothetical protein